MIISCPCKSGMLMPIPTYTPHAGPWPNENPKAKRKETETDYNHVDTSSDRVAEHDHKYPSLLVTAVMHQ